MLFTAKNSRFNRESNLLDRKIFLIENKNGLSYFAILLNNQRTIYCYCEKSLFDKEFTISEDAYIPTEILKHIERSKHLNKSTILRYPTDLKKLNTK